MGGAMRCRAAALPPGVWEGRQVLDSDALAAEPAEILLIDGHVPQVWQGFEFEEDTAEGLVAALAPPLRAVLRFYRTRRDVAFDHGSPVLISAEHSISLEALGRLSVAIEQ